MAKIEDLKNQLAEELADVAIKAMEREGFEVSDALREKIEEEIQWSIRLGK